MTRKNEFVKGTSLRVAIPGELVECLVHTYHRIRQFSVMRVAQVNHSTRPDCDRSYGFVGMQGSFKACNFRLLDDKFNPEFGGSFKEGTSDKMAVNERENESNVVPELRIYFIDNGRITHRILQNGNETAEEFVARGDVYLRNNPTAEAHLYRKYALRKTTPAPIENIVL